MHTVWCLKTKEDAFLEEKGVESRGFDHSLDFKHLAICGMFKLYEMLQECLLASRVLRKTSTGLRLDLNISCTRWGPLFESILLFQLSTSYPSKSWVIHPRESYSPQAPEQPEDAQKPARLGKTPWHFGMVAWVFFSPRASVTISCLEDENFIGF